MKRPRKTLKDSSSTHRNWSNRSINREKRWVRALSRWPSAWRCRLLRTLSGRSARSPRMVKQKLTTLETTLLYSNALWKHPQLLVWSTTRKKSMLWLNDWIFLTGALSTSTTLWRETRSLRSRLQHRSGKNRLTKLLVRKSSWTSQ
jgi:hypothetical protein